MLSCVFEFPTTTLILKKPPCWETKTQNTRPNRLPEPTTTKFPPEAFPSHVIFSKRGRNLLMVKFHYQLTKQEFHYTRILTHMCQNCAPWVKYYFTIASNWHQPSCYWSGLGTMPPSSRHVVGNKKGSYIISKLIFTDATSSVPLKSKQFHWQGINKLYEINNWSSLTFFASFLDQFLCLNWHCFCLQGSAKTYPP